MTDSARWYTVGELYDALAKNGLVIDRFMFPIGDLLRAGVLDQHQRWVESTSSWRLLVGIDAAVAIIRAVAAERRLEGLGQ